MGFLVANMFLKTYDRVSKNGYFDFFGGVSEMGVKLTMWTYDCFEETMAFKKDRTLASKPILSVSDYCVYSLAYYE